MGSEIEEFLRLAAERRRAKQQQKKKTVATPTPPKDSRRPRLTEVVDAEIVDAEPVSGDDVAADVARHLDTRDITDHASHLGSAIREEEKHLQSHVQQQFSRNVSSKPRSRTTNEAAPTKLTDEASVVTNNNAGSDAAFTEMIQLLRNPHTLQQALVLNEIFTRPEARWE